MNELNVKFRLFYYRKLKEEWYIMEYWNFDRLEIVLCPFKIKIKILLLEYGILMKCIIKFYKMKD